MQNDPHNSWADLSAGALRALRLASAHLNASNGCRIEPHELLAALNGKNSEELADPRLHAFFDEIEAETLTDLVLAGVITYRQLAKGAAVHLATIHENRRWLDERETF